MHGQTERMEHMKVAVLGFGTVGVGVYEMLKNAPGLEAGPVLVRPGKEDADFKVSSMEAILADPSVGAVAGLCGFRCNRTLDALFRSRLHMSMSDWRKRNAR